MGSAPIARPIRTAVGVALVLVVAGSLPLAVGSPPTTAGGDAVVSTAPESSPLPPGLNETGVTDPVRLVDAHATTLGNTSFTVTVTRTERFPNGTLRTRAETVGRHGPGDDLRYTTSIAKTVDRYYPGPAGTWEVWSNGSLTVGKFTNATGTDYQLRGRTDPSLDRQETLLVLFGSLETTVSTRTGTENTTGYRATADGIRHPEDIARAYGVESVQNVSFAAVVTPDGLVREYRLAFDAERSGGVTTRVVEAVRFTAVGSTTVSPPDWVSEAVAEGGPTGG